MRRWRWHGSDLQWCAIVSATFVALLLVNPLGFIGGGWDDWQYLEASRCWVEQGPCLPRTHWEGRWPVFAPIAAIVSLLGESRTTVGLWPLIASIAAIALLVLVGNRIAGRPVGWLAGLLFLVTPAFSIQILDPSVEAIELALILGGVLCILRWLETRSVRYALLAGLSFGLAFQARETALIAVVLAGMFVATRRPRAIDIAAATAGFLAPLAIELLVYGIATGDPLFRRMLSLSHTQIPSSELLGPVDKGSPFFNPAYIANWRHEPGIHLHWLIDGFANLFVNAKAGLSLSLVPLLYIIQRNRLTDSDRRMALALYGFALAYVVSLIYVFAIDPKARMMLAPLAATSIALAFLLHRLASDGRLLLVSAIGMAFASIGISILYVHQRIGVVEKAASAWIAERPDKVEIEQNTRRNLALIPNARELPGLNSDRSYLLFTSIRMSCSIWLEESGLPQDALEIIKEGRLSDASWLIPNFGGSLCLFRYRRPLDAANMLAAIAHARSYRRPQFGFR